MGRSRNKVAVPEGAAGSPPFYGVYFFVNLGGRAPVGVVGWTGLCGVWGVFLWVRVFFFVECVGALLGVWRSM